MGIPTKQRIRRAAEFRHVFARGNRTTGVFASIAAVQNGLPYSRFGLSVSKRVGNAVNRNLVKRRIRHALADLEIAGGWDVVVTAKSPAASVPYAMLDKTMQMSLERLGIRVNSPGANESANSEVGE
ncbi:MAG: ribonuclease P protein component [Chloroflexi bacterium]|nr:ribonuclease P protein component [Chloroflexota bacterium]